MLPFRLASAEQRLESCPLALYCIGCDEQPYLTRPTGFPAHQIFIGIHGSGVFRFINRTEIILQPNHFMLIPKGFTHEYDALHGEPWMLAYLGFNGGAAEAILASCDIVTLQAMKLNNLPLIQSELAELWQLVERNEGNPVHAFSKRIYGFLLALREASTRTNPKNKSPQKAAQLSLGKAVSLMHEHFSEPLQMRNLASAVGYSVQHFQRLFLEKYGITPHAYLQKIRLQQAILWLQQDETITIKSIAGRLQWEPNYFIRTFKNHYGISPGRYRENGLFGRL